MSRNRLIALLASSLLTFGVGAGYAQSKHETNLSQQDQQFANDAAQVNQAEMKLGNLAEQRGNNDAIKQFGRLMVQDHTKAWASLQQWAKTSDVTIPVEPSAKQDSEIRQMATQSGQNFDNTFVRDELQGHQKAIAAFEREIEQGRNPQLKQYAETNLPVIQDHIRIAEDLAGKMNMPGAAGLTDQAKAINASVLAKNERK